MKYRTMKKKTILRVRTIDCDKSRKSVHDEEITRYIAGCVKFEEKNNENLVISIENQ